MTQKFKKIPRKNLIGLFVALLIIATGGAYLIFKNTPNKGSGVISTLPGAEPSSQPAGTGSSDKASASPNAVSGSGSSSAINPSLVNPYGSFVSNHRPNLSGSPAPSEELSICNTTPGASCYIKFTKGGVTKTLPTETANSNGTTSWSWDVNQAGFTTGSWQITAVATLNGQSKSTNDTLVLEVQP